jgi:hypothetical protein
MPCGRRTWRIRGSGFYIFSRSGRAGTRPNGVPLRWTRHNQKGKFSAAEGLVAMWQPTAYLRARLGSASGKFCQEGAGLWTKGTMPIRGAGRDMMAPRAVEIRLARRDDRPVIPSRRSFAERIEFARARGGRGGRVTQGSDSLHPGLKLCRRFAAGLGCAGFGTGGKWDRRAGSGRIDNAAPATVPCRPPAVPMPRARLPIASICLFMFHVKRLSAKLCRVPFWPALMVTGKSGCTWSNADRERS